MTLYKNCYESILNTNHNNTYDISVSSCQENYSKCGYRKRQLNEVNDLKFQCISQKLTSPVDGYLDGFNVTDYSLVDGELCYLPQDCYQGLTCSLNETVGLKYCTSTKTLNSVCTDNRDCQQGYYCSTPTARTCQLQKKVNETCLNDDECQNWLGCLNGNCTEFYSQIPGTPMKSTDFRFCNSSFVYDNKCQELVLLDDTHQRSFTVNCTNNETCTYFLPLKNDIITLGSSDGYCNCGYNPDRIAYCKHGSDSIAYSELKILENKTLHQGCHVSKRYNCNLVTQKDLLNRQFLINSNDGKLQLVKNCVAYFMSKSYMIFCNLLVILFVLSVLL